MKVFEPFRLDAVSFCLWRGRERMRLSPKAFDILHYLVERADRLVTQDELLEALWPETYVNPEGIRKYILEIRRALGDRPNNPLFIETVPKRGYQFVAKVTDENAIPPSDAQTFEALNVGRNRVLSQFEGCADKSLSDQRRVVFVTREAWIGKTMLVDVYTILVEPLSSWLRRELRPEFAPHFEECRDSNTPIGNRVLHS